MAYLIFITVYIVVFSFIFILNLTWAIAIIRMMVKVFKSGGMAVANEAAGPEDKPNVTDMS